LGLDVSAGNIEAERRREQQVTTRSGKAVEVLRSTVGRDQDTPFSDDEDVLFEQVNGNKFHARSGCRAYSPTAVSYRKYGTSENRLFASMLSLAVHL